jgi:hypothetical protein
MDESKKSPPRQQPQGRRERDRAQDRRQQRRDYAAGADGEQDVTAGPTEAEETPRPAKQERTRKRQGSTDTDEQSQPQEQEVAHDGQADHSEREWGGDQDIDTAGMIPGNKAT